MSTNIYWVPVTYITIKIKYDFNQEIRAMIWLNFFQLKFITFVMMVPDNFSGINTSTNWNQINKHLITKLKSTSIYQAATVHKQLF